MSTTHTTAKHHTPPGLDKLWAPWRIHFVGKKKKPGCIFCQAARAKLSKQAVYKSAHSLALLNIYPYNNGHMMVSPLRHTADLNALTQDELLDLINTVILIKNALRKTLKPQGFNIGMNLSADGGAGITDHLHIHIVPRWRGDTNFMPVLGSTKVISQSLEELHRIMKKELAHAPVK